jgi:hypothetical protein
MHGHEARGLFLRREVQRGWRARTIVENGDYGRRNDDGRRNLDARAFEHREAGLAGRSSGMIGGEAQHAHIAVLRDAVIDTMDDQQRLREH